MKSQPIIFFFNSPLSSGCDYVLQTIQIVSRNNPVYGFALGDIISLPRLLMEKDKWITRKVNGAIIIRPISLIPFVRLAWVRMLTYFMGAIILRLIFMMQYVGKRKILWFFEPFHMPWLLSVFVGYVSVYDCVDYYPGFNSSAASEHNEIMKKAAYVFANSPPLAKQLRRQRKDVICVPLGFADSIFRKTASSKVRLQQPVYTVGFVGSISDRIDFSLLQYAIETLPHIRFVFVGALETGVFGQSGTVVESFRKLRLQKNVVWEKFVNKTQVPKVISQFDIGIIPYRIENAFNRFSFPMKSLEYFAMGKPVISTNIISLQSFAHKKLLTIINNELEFVSAIRAIKQQEWSKRDQKRQLALALTQTWEAKIAAIYAALDPRGSINE